MSIVIFSAKIYPEGGLLDNNCYLEKPNFMFKKIFIEHELSLFNTRQTALTAGFGKTVFYFL